MYKNLNDHQLLEMYQYDEEAKKIIFEKYKPLIISLAKKCYDIYPNCGAETSDFIQDGMLGFSKAVESYRESKGTRFATYARKCILFSLLNSARNSVALKYGPLNEALSLELLEEDGNLVVGDISHIPENLVLNCEDMQELIVKINGELTSLESQVFELKLSGFSNDEISIILDISIKQIYNALHRIKYKVKKISKK